MMFSIKEKMVSVADELANSLITEDNIRQCLSNKSSTESSSNAEKLVDEALKTFRETLDAKLNSFFTDFDLEHKLQKLEKITTDSEPNADVSVSTEPSETSPAESSKTGPAESSKTSSAESSEPIPAYDRAQHRKNLMKRWNELEEEYEETKVLMRSLVKHYIYVLRDLMTKLKLSLDDEDTDENS